MLQHPTWTGPVFGHYLVAVVGPRESLDNSIVLAAYWIRSLGELTLAAVAGDVHTPTAGSLSNLTLLDRVGHLEASGYRMLREIKFENLFDRMITSLPSAALAKPAWLILKLDP